MVPAGMATYPASLGGYRTVDASRYERRRYGSPIRRLNLRLTERAIARALADVPAGSLVLDVPSGTGIFHDALRARGLRVVAADLSPTMLAVARSRGEAAGYVRADARHLPFRRERFDAALCTRFLMHLDADARIATLQALTQLTNGPVVATVCHPYTVKTAGRELRRYLGRTVKQSPRLTRAELDEELRRGDLRLTQLIPVAPILSEVWVVAVTAG
jgi:SAM-dependent methyltransferase